MSLFEFRLTLAAFDGKYPSPIISGKYFPIFKQPTFNIDFDGKSLKLYLKFEYSLIQKIKHATHY